MEYIVFFNNGGKDTIEAKFVTMSQDGHYFCFYNNSAEKANLDTLLTKAVGVYKISEIIGYSKTEPKE